MNPEEHNDTPPSKPFPEEQPIVTEPAQVPEQPLTSPSETVDPIPPLTPQNKSHKKLIIVSLIVAAIIGASVGYYLFAMKKNSGSEANSTPATSSKNVTQAPAQPTNTAVDAITKSLTDGSTGETTLTNTDNSSDGTDASTSAGTVGDSVDENNF
jgi:uncharacterized protein HemX